MNRRDALRSLAGWLAASSVLRAQDDVRLVAAGELVNVFEVEAIAKAKLSRQLYDHISRGAGAEVTMGRNRDAFDRITFRPRVLIDVREMDLRCKLLGQDMEWPVLIAPLAGQQLIHLKGEGATVQGAASTNTVAVMIAGATPMAPHWCEVDATVSQDKVQTAAKNGCQALLVSFGVPYEGTRERDLKNGLIPAVSPHPSRLVSRSGVARGWDVLQQIKGWSGLPIVAKGIMHPGDAKMAIEKGVQAIVVSNYGGFYVDGAPATMDVLPSIVEAVNGHVPVLIDGGFRRGTDILKALALGANAVMVGRPILWGLAAYGADGVQKVLELLQTELALAMGLCGVPNIARIKPSLVKVHRKM